MKKKPFESCVKTALFLLSFVLIAPQMSIADDAARYCDQGTDFLRDGNFSEAIAALTTAVTLRPGYAIAYNNRGLAYYKQDKYVKAAETSEGQSSSTQMMKWRTTMWQSFFASRGTMTRPCFI